MDTSTEADWASRMARALDGGMGNSMGGGALSAGLSPMHWADRLGESEGPEYGSPGTVPNSVLQNRYRIGSG